MRTGNLVGISILTVIFVLIMIGVYIWVSVGEKKAEKISAEIVRKEKERREKEATEAQNK